MKMFRLLSVFLFLILFRMLIFAQGQAGPLPIYKSKIDVNKLYKQGQVTVLSSDDDVRVYSSVNHQTENSIAINPANPQNILISTNGRAVHNSNGDFVTVHQPYFYTTDGGITWSGSENNPNNILIPEIEKATLAAEKVLPPLVDFANLIPDSGRFLLV